MDFKAKKEDNSKNIKKDKKDKKDKKSEKKKKKIEYIIYKCPKEEISSSSYYKAESWDSTLSKKDSSFATYTSGSKVSAASAKRNFTKSSSEYVNSQNTKKNIFEPYNNLYIYNNYPYKYPLCNQPIKGEKGDKGERGDNGEKGSPGLPGIPGLKGEKGEKGEPGIRGEIGPRGDPGIPGLKGEKGEKGEKGDKGEPGLRGEKGERGNKGDIGLTGSKGDKGDKGDRGEKGDKGDKGDKGIRGDRGEKGDRGDRGEKGIRGEKGNKGDRGERGEKGERGESGERGEKGEPGFSSLISSTIFVDVNGNDETGEKYNPNKPFKTLSCAEEKALPGECITVGPGKYESSLLKKCGIIWNFLLGSIVTRKSDNSSLFFIDSDIVIASKGIFDANGGTLLTIPENSTGLVTLEIEQIINSIVDNNSPLFLVSGGKHIKMTINRISSGKQGIIQFAGSPLNRPSLNFSSDYIETGSNAISFSLGNFCESTIKCDTLLNPAGYSLSTIGGDHIIKFGSAIGNISLGCGTTFLNATKITGSILCSAGTNRITIASLKGATPFAITGKSNNILNIEEILMTDSGLLLTPDSETVLEANIGTIRNEGPASTGILINPCVYTPGILPEITLNIRNIFADCALRINNDVRISLDATINKAILIGIGIVINRIEAISEVKITSNFLIATRECYIIETPLTGHPNITLSGYFSSSIGSAVIVTSANLKLENCILDGVASLRTPLQISPIISAENCKFIKDPIPPIKI
jgi:hypothetical protein